MDQENQSAACLEQPLRVKSPSPAGCDSRPRLIRLIHRSFCVEEPQPVQHQSHFSGWEEKKKKIICDSGQRFLPLLRIPATKAPSVVSSSSQQRRKVHFLMRLFAFFIRLSSPARIGEVRSFQTRVSSDGAPVSALTEGLELLQPGHGRGIIVLPGHHSSRLLVPHKT